MAERKTPREVLADLIVGWAGEADLYQYVDKIINELRHHDYGIVTDACVTCGEQIDGVCDKHGYAGMGIDKYLAEINEVTPGVVFGWVDGARGPDPSPDLMPEDERYQVATDEQEG